VDSVPKSNGFWERHKGLRRTLCSLWYNNPVKKQGFQIALTIILSIAAIILALRGISIRDVQAALAQVDWRWMWVTLILIAVTLFIRAARWRVLLGYALSWRDALGLIGIGYLISGVLPLRAGDPARAVGATLRGRVSALAALSTVVVERVLDMLLIILILVATLPRVPGLQAYLASGEISGGLSLTAMLVLSGGLTVAILLLFISLAVFPKTVERLAQAALVRLKVSHPERWLRPVRSVTEGLGALRSARDGSIILLWSVLLWTVTASYFLTMLWACQAFLPEGSPLMALVAMWASAFGMVFPATGGIGSFHFAVREALFWGFSVPRDFGFAYAVLVHALPYLMGIAIGALALLLWGMSPRRLIARGQTVSQTANDASDPEAQSEPDLA